MNRIPTIADVLMSRCESDDIYIGDTPEQLGTIQAADAIMIDGKIVTREDVRKLQQERNELAATVDRMSTFIKLSAKKWEGVPEVEPTFWNLLRVANESTKQHLRDVRAEAGRAGFIAGWASWSAKGDVKVRSDNYAERVRAGEV